MNVFVLGLSTFRFCCHCFCIAVPSTNFVLETSSTSDPVSTSMLVEISSTSSSSFTMPSVSASSGLSPSASTSPTSSSQ